MSTITPVSFAVDGEHVAESLQSVRENLNTTTGEALLDFFFVQRLDPSGLTALEELAGTADVLNTKVILRGVNVEIYKVLKLAMLAERFSFVD